MIDYQEVLEIHQVLMREFGGSQGVRDENGLKSALERPFSGFGETEFYPSPEEKAGAILESIVKNHPFIDGKKKNRLCFNAFGFDELWQDIQATQDEKYDIVIAVASGKLDFQQIVTWIKQRTADK